jgi:hypothetical protein
LGTDSLQDYAAEGIIAVRHRSAGIHPYQREAAMFRGRQERHRISAGTQPTSSPFSLLRWFSLLSLACIALIGVALSLLMSGFLADNMLKRDSELSQQFVSSIAEAESAWVYFEEMRQGPPSAQVRSSFDSFLKRLPQLPEVARANVYGRDRSIIWSNVSAFVGHRFDNNPELEKAFAGELAVESGTVGARNDKSEHVAFDKAELSLKFVERPIFPFGIMTEARSSGWWKSIGFHRRCSRPSPAANG